MKKRRNLIVIIILFLSVGVTIAYLQSTDTFENIFNAGTYSVVTHEEFTSPTNWKPGDEIPKTITTTNEGTIPVRVRIKLDEVWKNSNDEELPLNISASQKISIINLDNKTDWIYGDYYYYVNELAPGETTSSLIKSVTFNPNYTGNLVCTFNSITNSNECSSSDEYMGGTYSLKITIETVQADKYREVWGGLTPILYNYVGDNPCSYNGELVYGTEYVNGQYTYRYSSNGELFGDGWSVYLTDKSSTSPVTSMLCSSINNKPIISMNNMFFGSQATSIDLSNFDTSNVNDMRGMFGNSQATTLNLSSFDTSNVINMVGMFYNS